MNKDALLVIWSHIILSNTNNYQADETLTDTTIPGQSEPGSNGIEKVLHTTQIWSLRFRCNLVSYPEQPVLG